MKILVIPFLLIANSLFSQTPSGGGYYEQYHKAGIKSYSYYSVNRIDSSSLDTVLVKNVYFDQSGRMTKEQFEYSPGYTAWFAYEYNFEGYLTRIDSFGLIGRGYGTSGPDTLYSQVCETSESFNNTTRIVKKMTTHLDSDYECAEEFIYNRNGQLVRTNCILLQNKLRVDAYTEYHYNEKGLIVQVKSFSKGDQISPEYSITTIQLWVYDYW